MKPVTTNTLALRFSSTVRRLARSCAGAVSVLALAGAGIAQAANSPVVVNAGANVDLSLPASYAGGAIPSTTNDVNFTGAYTGTTTVDGATLSFGTLDDNTTTALLISNTSATAGSIQLNTPSNSVSGTAADLLYVKSGGTLTMQSGTGTLTLILNASGNIDTVGTLNVSGPVTLTSSAATTTFTGNGKATISGNITGNGTNAITVNDGSGSVTLSGTNSYTGATTLTAGNLILSGNDAAVSGGLTVTAGTLDINSAGGLGTGALTINGGTIANTSGAAVTETNPVAASAVTLGGNFTLGTSANTGGIGNLNFGAGAVSLTGNRTITLAGTGATYTFGGFATSTGTSANTQTINGAGNTLVFAGGYVFGGNNGNASTVFNGTGNVTLLGTLEGYGGTVNQGLTYSGTGTLTLGGNIVTTGLVSVTQGSLVLDFSQEAAPATATNIINTNGSLALTTALTVKGASGGTNSQRLANLDLVGANNQSITFNQNGATSLSVNAGNIHRSLQSTVDVTLPTTGSLTTTGSGAQGVIGSMVANGGTTWATFDVPTGSINALGSYATGASNYTSTKNVDVTDGDTVSNVTVNTLRFNSANETLNLSGNNLINQGILITPNSSSATITGGAIEANNPTGELVIQNYGGTLNVGSDITDNGNSPTSVTIGGTGTTSFSGATSYTGLTTLTGGTLSLNGSNLTLAALAGGINSTLALGNNTLYINNGANNAIYSGTITGSGFSAIVKEGTGAEYIANPLVQTQTYVGAIIDANGWLEINNTIGANSNPLVLGGGLSGTSASAAPTTLYLNGGNQNAVQIDGGGTGALTLIGNGFLDSSSNTGVTLVNDPTVTFSTFGYDYLGRLVTSGQLSEKGGVTGAGNILLNAGNSNSPQFYATAINNTGSVTDMSLGTSGNWNIGNTGTNAGFGANVTALVMAADGGGNLDYQPQNDTGFVGPIYVVAGTLMDDTSENNAGTSNVISSGGLFNSAVTLTMGGGTFQFKGNSTDATAAYRTQDQVLNGLTLNAGSSTIDVDNPGAASYSTTLDLTGGSGKTITRNVGGTVNFTASVGTFGTTSVVKTASANDAGGILGGYATVAGTNWATVNSGVIQALGSYGTLAASTSATNVDLGAGAQAANNLAANTLRFNAAATALTLTGTNVLTDGGILMTSAATGANSITGGTLEGASGADLVVIQNNNSVGLTIGSTIADNGSATALTKSGTGTLTLTNTANTYSGATYINAGILNVASLAASGSASSIGTDAANSAADLVLNGGTMQYTGSTAANLSRNYTLTTAGGGFDASGTGALTISGAMTVTGTTLNTDVGGTLTASDVGGAQNLNLTGTGTGFYSGIITNGSVNDDYTAVNKTGTGTWTLSNANTYTGFTTINAGTLVASNVSALGNVNGTNVVNPALVVFSGSSTLDIATDTSINPYDIEQQTTGTATILVDRATSGATVTQNLGWLSMTSGTFTATKGSNVTGTPLLTFTGLVLNNSGGSGYTVNANSSAISILGNVTATANAGGFQTLTLANNNAVGTGVSTITGNISDGVGGGALNLTRNGGYGTWVLSGANTFSGATTITTGALNIQNNSALGSALGSSTSSVSVANGGALQLQGGITTTTAIALNLNGSGVGSPGYQNGALENVSGNNNYTGLVTLTGTGVYIGSDNAGDTLLLSNTGTITGSNGNNDNLTFQGAGNITLDSAIGTVNGQVTKNGTGTLTLVGASTYAGNTSVSAGTLLADNTSGSATGTGNVTVSSGATLGGGSTALNGGTLFHPDTNGASLKVYQGNTTGIITGAVTINSGGILAPGNSVGTITMAKLTLSGGAVANYEFNSTANDFTLVTTSGGLTLGSAGFNLYSEGTTNAFDAPGVYDLIGYSGSLVGTTAGLTVLNQQAGFNYAFSNDAADDIIQLDITAAPEPSSWALMLGGVGLMIAVGQWRRIGRRAE